MSFIWVSRIVSACIIVVLLPALYEADLRIGNDEARHKKVAEQNVKLEAQAMADPSHYLILLPSHDDAKDGSTLDVWTFPLRTWNGTLQTCTVMRENTADMRRRELLSAGCH